MLGPINVLGPFVKMTKRADDRFRRQLAIRATIFSCLALAAAALVGERSLRDYGVSLNVLMLTGGLVLSVVAFQTIFQQFRPVHSDETGFSENYDNARIFPLRPVVYLLMPDSRAGPRRFPTAVARSKFLK